MTAATVNSVDDGQSDDAVPPIGTAIVRPLRHVRAVRERHARRFVSPTEAAESRSARAWAWALGEIATAPVTDHQTPAPPTRPTHEAAIAAAEHRPVSAARAAPAHAAPTT